MFLPSTLGSIFMYLLNQEDADLSLDVGPNYDAKGNVGPRLPFTMYPPPASAPDAAITLDVDDGGYALNGTINLTGDDGQPTFLNMSAVRAEHNFASALCCGTAPAVWLTCLSSLLRCQTLLGCSVSVVPVSNVSIDMSTNLLLSSSQPARQLPYAVREWQDWIPTALDTTALYSPDTYAFNQLASTAGPVLDITRAPSGTPATTARNTAACISRPAGTCHIDTMAESFLAQQLWKARYALYMDDKNLPTREIKPEDLKKKNTLALIEESLANVTVSRCGARGGAQR